jgi:hypothetical protein
VAPQARNADLEYAFRRAREDAAALEARNANLEHANSGSWIRRYEVLEYVLQQKEQLLEDANHVRTQDLWALRNSQEQATKMASSLIGLNAIEKRAQSLQNELESEREARIKAEKALREMTARRDEPGRNRVVEVSEMVNDRAVARQPAKGEQCCISTTSGA